MANTKKKHDEPDKVTCTTVPIYPDDEVRMERIHALLGLKGGRHRATIWRTALKVYEAVLKEKKDGRLIVSQLPGSRGMKLIDTE